MTEARAGRSGRAGRASNERRFAQAYREGLGLAAVAIIRTPMEIRIAALGPADADLEDPAANTEIRWWCRSADVERVAATAEARLRRRTAASMDGTAALSLARTCVLTAARQLSVALLSDDEVAAAAADVVARVETEMQRLQCSGEMRSVNKAYRTYRLEASARGERVTRYDDWMQQYKEKLVREVASTLRHL